MGNQFTVIFTQDIPIGGVAAIHYSFETADSPEQAADRCRGSVGGHSTLIAVFAERVEPLLMGGVVHAWDDTAGPTRKLEFKRYR